MLSFIFLLACSPSHLTVADLSAGDIILSTDPTEERPRSGELYVTITE
jgi:hypothetical protein